MSHHLFRLPLRNQRARCCSPLLLTLLAVLNVLFCPESAAVAVEAPLIRQVSVGVNDTFKIGCWTAVKITGENYPPGNYLVQAGVLDVDGNYAVYELPQVTVDDSQQLTAQVPVRIQRVGSDVHVKIYQHLATSSTSSKSPNAPLLISEFTHPSRQLTGLSQSAPWIVAAGTVEGIELTTDFVRDLQITKIEEISQLPENTLAWQGINVIFLPARELPETELLRLLDWVHHGGAAVVFPTQTAEEFLQLPLTQLLPIQFDGTAQIRDLSRLVSFVGEPSPLRISSMTIPRISEVQGKTLVGGLTGPVATLSPWGLGQVTVLTVNLNERVFQNWAALPQLYRLLANFPVSKGNEAEISSNLLTQNGLTDFKTQWVAALANFGVKTPNVWLPLGSLLLAALLIGPIDYFLVRHFFKKSWLTWITFPALILLATCWGLFDGQARTIRAATEKAAEAARLAPDAVSPVIGNQCTVLDYALQTGTLRYYGFSKLLAPETGRYQVQAAVTLPREIPVTKNHWIGPGGVPEASFRGYYRSSGTHLDQTRYQIKPVQLSIQGLPIYEHSTAIVEVRGTQSVTQEDSTLVDADLHSITSTQLRGSLTHHLGSPVTDWVLAYGRLLYFVPADHPLASLEPGETLQFPGSAIHQKELTAYLTGTTTQLIKRSTGVGEDLLVKRQPYNVFNQDLHYIFSRLTFHQALGGREYTSLTNTELGNWDLSNLLDLNLAVLVGRLKNPMLSTQVDSAEIVTIKNETFVRLVIPVAQRTVVPERLPEFDPNKQKTP